MEWRFTIARQRKKEVREGMKLRKQEKRAMVRLRRKGMETLTPENQATVEAMKSALSNAELPQDMTLYRGTSTEALGLLQNLPTDELVGKTFTEQGFMSTSTSSAVAGDFSGNMQITIEAAKGAQALDISSISQYNMEAEVLFNVNQEMLITSVEVENGVLHVTAIIK